MMQVLVADPSAVVRSVLKEIILKTKKLVWSGEAITCSELRTFIKEKESSYLLVQ